MTLRPEVITGLRSLFNEGVTFSGLLRYILKQHADERLDQFTIQQYLSEAFSVAFHHPLKRNVDSPTNDDYYATIDSWLIPEILANRSSWMSTPQPNSEEQGWYNTLKMTEQKQVQREKPFWLHEASWEAMSTTEQDHLINIVTSCAVFSEQVLLFARLAEQLQRRVSELEAKEARSELSLQRT